MNGSLAAFFTLGVTTVVFGLTIVAVGVGGDPLIEARGWRTAAVGTTFLIGLYVAKNHKP